MPSDHKKAVLCDPTHVWSGARSSAWPNPNPRHDQMNSFTCFYTSLNIDHLRCGAQLRSTILDRIPIVAFKRPICFFVFFSSRVCFSFCWLPLESSQLELVVNCLLCSSPRLSSFSPPSPWLYPLSPLSPRSAFSVTKSSPGTLFDRLPLERSLVGRCPLRWPIARQVAHIGASFISPS